jgi:hypothetical protein
MKAEERVKGRLFWEFVPTLDSSPVGPFLFDPRVFIFGVASSWAVGVFACCSSAVNLKKETKIG